MRNGRSIFSLVVLSPLWRHDFECFDRFVQRAGVSLVSRSTGFFPSYHHYNAGALGLLFAWRPITVIHGAVLLPQISKLSRVIGNKVMKVEFGPLIVVVAPVSRYVNPFLQTSNSLEIHEAFAARVCRCGHVVKVSKKKVIVSGMQGKRARFHSVGCLTIALGLECGLFLRRGVKFGNAMVLLWCWKDRIEKLIG